MGRIGIACSMLALLGIVSCGKEKLTFLTDPDAIKVNAVVGVITKSFPMGTLAEQKTFAVGDKISVTNEGVAVTYVKGADGIWTPEDNTQYLRWNKDDLHFTAHYPASPSAFVLPSDQSSLAKMAAADYMTADWTVSGIPTEHILDVELTRQMALVNFRIEGYNDQFDEETDKVSSVTVCDYVRNGASPMVTALLIHDGSKFLDGTVEGGIGFTYSAIVPTTKGPASYSPFIEITMANYQPTLYQSNLQVIGVPVLESGYSYTYGLIIGKDTIRISNVTVSEWKDGGEIHRGDLNGGF